MTPKKVNISLRILLAVLILSIGGGIYFANRQLTSLASETSRLKAEIKVSESQLKVYQQTKLKVDSLAYVNELADKVLPEDKEQSVIVAELSQFALRSRLAVAEINFPEKAEASVDKTKPLKGVTVVPMTIKFKDGAKYENILEFLRTVEANRRKMQVANISLTPDEENRSLLNEVTVAINLYSKGTTTEKKP